MDMRQFRKKAEPADKTFVGSRDRGLIGKDVFYGRAFDRKVGSLCDEFENFMARCMIVQDVKCYSKGVCMDDYRTSNVENGSFRAYIEVPNEFAADLYDVIFNQGEYIVPEITWEEDYFPRICADMKGYEIKKPNHTVFGWVYEYMPANEVHLASEVRSDIGYLLTQLEYTINQRILSESKRD